MSAGNRLLPHQIEAVKFALARRRGYLALDPGLGKTAVAAVVARLLTARERVKVVYLTPPFLVRNVKAEFQRWSPSLRVEVYAKVDLQSLRDQIDVLLVPDSLVTRGATYQDVAGFAAAGGRAPSLLFVDEAHRFKEPKSSRTAALFGRPARPERKERPARHGRPALKAKPAEPAVPGLVHLFERRLYLSGSPMPNGRPMELYPLIASEAPETINFMNEWDFGRRFCDGKETHFGWDFKGASNLKELAARLRGGRWPFMLRMRKELLKLPPKIEELFIVSADMSPKLARLDQDVSDAYGGGPDVIRKILAARVGFDSAESLVTASYRRLLGQEKVKPAAEYLDAILESGEAVLVFALHVDVVEGLAKALAKWQPFVITGKTPMAQRQPQVDEFQSSKTRNIFIGNIQAMGVGFTLTKATRVVFAEASWVPEDNNQASDRAHRIGQASSVLVQFLCYQNSVDADVINTVIKKSRATREL